MKTRTMVNAFDQPTGPRGGPSSPMERCVTADGSRQGAPVSVSGPPSVTLLHREELEKLVDVTPEGMRILQVLSDPSMVGRTVAEKINAAQVSKRTWYRYTRDPGFKRICGIVIREILLGLEPELVAIALREARNGSWKHFEWLSERTSLADSLIKPVGGSGGILEGTTPQEQHLHLHGMTDEALRHYVETGEWIEPTNEERAQSSGEARKREERRAHMVGPTRGDR